MPDRLFPAKYFRLFIALTSALLSSFVLYSAFAAPNPNPVQATEVMNIPGYPYVFELNVGDSIQIDREFEGYQVSRILLVKEVHLFTENNTWFPDSLGKCNYYK